MLDPFYQASIGGIENGAYQLKELAADNFTRTEYYKAYYKGTHINDEICYIQAVPNQGHGFFHLSLVCRDDLRRFSSSTARFLKGIAPIINGLLLKQWELYFQNNNDQSTANIHDQLENAMEVFGNTILTARERSVLKLILHGHSNESASRQLKIAISTVKLHRKHMYQKLEINSQAELFYLFINAVSYYDPEKNTDPLDNYLKHHKV